MFWVDLTHQHPIFLEVAPQLRRAADFRSTFVYHATGSGDLDRDPFATGGYADVASDTTALDVPSRRRRTR
jgi:hypothetical protein